MNTSFSDLDLQRLIDGELSEQEQQSLLSALDAADDWRRVALAFVEQQVWSQTWDEVPIEPASVRGVMPLRAPRERRLDWLALALTTVIAAGIGFFAGDQTNEPVTEREMSVAGATGSDAAPGAVAITTPQPVMNVELVSSDPEAAEPLTIPVYDASVADFGFWDETPLIPDDLQEQLFRQGYDIHQAREFYRIPLDDGSEIALPVDTVHVRYAGL